MGNNHNPFGAPNEAQIVDEDGYPIAQFAAPLSRFAGRARYARVPARWLSSPGNNASRMTS
jgi:hypothetical protein